MFDKVHWKLIFVLLFFYIIVGLIVGLIMYHYYPDYYFSWYPAIPGYFTLMGLVLFRCMIVCRRNNPKKIINVYMMMRGIKLFITLLSLLLYTLYIDVNTFEFAMVTLGFYFFYLIIETYIFIKFEKERIKK
ncbi:MAG: hypothetical protein WCX48_04275 [Bacteroidales bacterium]|jgi:hypothetical protein